MATGAPKMGVTSLVTGTALCLLITCSWLPGATGARARSVCNTKAELVVQDLAYYCMSPLLRGFNSRSAPFPANFYQLDGWNYTCMGSANLSYCIHHVESFSDCSNSQRQVFLEEAKKFVEREWKRASFYPRPGTCEGFNYRANITQLYQVMTEDCRQQVTDIVGLCSETWLDQRDMDFNRSRVQKAADIVYSCVRDRGPARCGSAGRALARFILDQTFPPDTIDNFNNTVLERSPTSTNPTYMLDERRSTVGVFGDPHLKVYRNYQLLTCEVSGHREYLVHPYFKVTAKADYVQKGASKATAITHVIIEFFDDKRESVCVYEVSHGDLPIFLNKNCASTKIAGSHELILVEESPGAEVRLRVVSLGLVVYVQLWGSYYSVVLRMADQAFTEASGLLVDGCTIRDYIYTQDEVWSLSQSAAGKVQREQCSGLCHPVNNSRSYHYHSACLYDCMSTRDQQSWVMSQQFQASLPQIEDEDLTLPLLPVILQSRSKAGEQLRAAWQLTVACLGLWHLVRLSHLGRCTV